MNRRGRSLFVVALVALATAVLGVSVAWACTGPDVGTPATPAAPPSSDAPSPSPDGGTTTSPPPASTGGGGVAEPAPAPALESRGTESNSTSGSGAPARSRGRSQGGVTQPAPSRSGSPVGNGTGTAVAGEQFAARESGATAGVVNEGGQPVFASSSASKGKKAQSKSTTGTPSERSALGDAWSGFDSGASSSGSKAPVASLSENGSGSTLGMAILGLGVMGVLGTLLLLAASRRRRAEVSSESTTTRGRGSSV